MGSLSIKKKKSRIIRLSLVLRAIYPALSQDSKTNPSHRRGRFVAMEKHININVNDFIRSTNTYLSSWHFPRTSLPSPYPSFRHNATWWKREPTTPARGWEGKGKLRRRRENETCKSSKLTVWFPIHQATAPFAAV